MNVMETLTLVLVIFAVLSYADIHHNNHDDDNHCDKQ